MVPSIHLGHTAGFIFGTDVHILKSSRTSYVLCFKGSWRAPYCCQDGCCDGGLRSDVEKIVQTAKERGATRVVLRTGLGSNYVRTIAGLPVSDVSNHVGELDDGYSVRRSYG